MQPPPLPPPGSPPGALIPDTENIGWASFMAMLAGELYLRKRDNGGYGRTSEPGGWGAGGAAKDFVVSRTFYSVSSGWRLLSASQRTNSSSPSSSSLSIPLSSGLSLSPFPPSPPLALSFVPYPSLKALRNSQQPSPSRILLLKIFLSQRFS